jgi:hypothetical protein
MERTQARARLRQLAEDSIKRGDPTGWFDDLYRGAAGDTEAIPWAHLTANSLHMEWITRHQPRDEAPFFRHFRAYYHR